MTIHDISEDIPLDLTPTVESTTFQITDTAYDVVIDNIPFMLSISNQNPYLRQTAQYRKDQFDNSTEPGEQSLTGWWLRSQTSFHNGAGIEYYEPGTDYQHVSYRYEDSRGVDVWTVGQASLLDDVFHSYTGASGIVGETAVYEDTLGNKSDILISGDGAGVLNKITFNGDSVATVTPYSLFTGHNVGVTDKFLSVTTDGTRYFAACGRAIHRGSTAIADKVIYYLGTSTVNQVKIKFVKGYLMLGLDRSIYILNPDKAEEPQHTNNSSLPTPSKTHKSLSWVWNDFVEGNRFIYASGHNNTKSEIWAIPFASATAGTDLLPDPASAVQVVQMPFGERINTMYFYLGFLALGTSKGIRICTVDDTGGVTLGPLLFETHTLTVPSSIPTGVTGFVANDRYIWAATSVEGDNGNDNGVLVRVDLSSQFDDGGYPWAYDLQYESDKDSYCTGAFYANNRLHLIITEPEELPAGEIQTQNLSKKRASGWLKTGKIRYGMIEPKYFKYINATIDAPTGNTVSIDVINQLGEVKSVSTITYGLSNQDIPLSVVKSKQEQVSFKFTLNNTTLDDTGPILYGYQIKAVPATRRQRMIQYPMSCFNTERDRFDVEFGYSGRAIEVLQKLEAIEQTGRFVTITDYRVNETYEGIIEEVRFTNESSPDRDSSGFGGLLLVTVRKM